MTSRDQLRHDLHCKAFDAKAQEQAAARIIAGLTLAGFNAGVFAERQKVWQSRYVRFTAAALGVSLVDELQGAAE